MKSVINLVESGSHPVKVTALLYFKDALEGEQFEGCLDYMTIAREFGATEKEIDDVIDNWASRFKAVSLPPVQETDSGSLFLSAA
jgi:hypothetical protein